MEEVEEEVVVVVLVLRSECNDGNERVLAVMDPCRSRRSVG